MSPRILIKKYVFIIIPAVIVFLAAAVVVLPMLFPAPPQARPPAAVTLFEVRTVPVKDSWEAVAFAAAPRKVDLVARVSGFLAEKPYSEGGAVSEGDVLFLIEPAQYQAALDAARGDLQSAEARRAQAQITFDRQSDLFAKKSAPKSDFDDAKAALDVAEAGVTTARASLAQAQLNLGYATVRAPFSGYVSDSPFSVGAFVGPTSGVLATVVATDPLELSFGVPDRLMADLKHGSPGSRLPRGGPGSVAVRVRAADGRDYPHAGAVSYISPMVDDATGTYKLKALVPNPDGLLAPGETLTIFLEDAEPREALLVPKGSVLVSADSGSYVFTVGPPDPPAGGAPPAGAPAGPGGGAAAEALVAKRINVSRGNEFPDGIEILEGLKAGDRIIELGLMSGGATLRAGAPVRVVEGYDPSASGAASGGPSPEGAASGGPSEGSGTPSESAGGEGD
ncbi:MAG: efflux RND transporter periplasmic adaptor subunit [Deltaproteobacteria bacterium]|jgi:membrane fusion protein (multidrug efflux system)|nr:efflux RND transporter periplasmic adaptor subunit [Deltaproteobacteria bacterium]